MAKALASPKTPPHLKPHLQNALGVQPSAVGQMGAQPMPVDPDAGMETAEMAGSQIGRSVDPNAGFMNKGPMQNKPAKVVKPIKVKNVKSGLQKKKPNPFFGS